MSNRRNPPGLPLNGRKLERDEDLLLFRELHKRDKDRIATLLQPVSDEFEPNGGNYALYRIASGKKASGYEFFPENNKNDYDWLKTPPATPLFPSLEMEAKAPQLVIQRELPIVQPLSRFSGYKESYKAGSIGRPKSPNPNPKVPSRSITPSHRPSIPSTEAKNTKLPAPILFNQKTSQPICTHPLTNKRTNVVSNTSSISSKPYSNQKDDHIDFLSSNLSKTLGTSTNKTKPRSRGVSPLARSTIPVQFDGISDETPPNLKTDRSTSATRGRPQPTVTPAAVAVHQKAEPSSTPKPRRQSCSPCVTRGRRVEPKQAVKGTQVLGSRMVEKVMNARKSSVEERDTKQKLRAASIDERTKPVEIKRDRNTSRHPGIFLKRG
ncbi:muscle M-line assembly protein unc-89-like isoform X2 [Herrania umbratica]|uniref:Muscle M-line assembly protein unc-89-like isoform X2 n=1 Tax=Herrania umbratica TaxID=108875 RepID=A0A6J0ZL56_9ROSI|nr:muscle M-line assembly protein unc-89-like isoform X2 [Herrania umbratica]XP_021275552.1 muscle M-line assembly protein unc-89-like isoform X2 [Herrania umbratica]XP_021275553.1 muscle M-line assembly protein unc-89-like isoform X2 [Herrania umbratica]